MTRSWASEDDHRWVMFCDYCPTKSEPRASQADHPLGEYRDQGWFVAKVFGDRCPKCVRAAGGLSAISAEPYRGGAA